jgi:hypothetical protein
VKEREEKLLERLELERYTNLRQADRLVQEMEEGIYPEGIVAQLNAAEATSQIEVDQAVIYPNEPVVHRLVFSKNELNTATAREEFVYVWGFGRQYKEKSSSFSIWHFYSGAGSYPVSVEVIGQDGKTVATLEKVITVDSAPLRLYFRERTVVEAVRAGVAWTCTR